MKAVAVLVSVLVIYSVQLAAGESEQDAAVGQVLNSNVDTVAQAQLNRDARGEKKKSRQDKIKARRARRRQNQGKKKVAKKQKGTKKSRGGKKKKGKQAKRRQRNQRRRRKSKQRRGKKPAKKGKKKSRRGKQGKRRNRGQGKGKKRGKGNKKRKRTKSKKKTPKTKTVNSGVRQACNLTCVVDKIKLYVKYSNNLRQIKRTKTFVTQSNNKAAKAKAGEFDDTKNAVNDSTSGGSACNGGSLSTTQQDEVDTIKNCSATAAALCTITLNSTTQSRLDNCEAPLDTWIKAFQSCYQTDPTCSCFDGITDVATDCQNNFKSINDETKAARRKCTNGDSKGSFGSCRKVQRTSASLVKACKPECPSATTRAAGFRRHRNIFRFRNVLNV